MRLMAAFVPHRSNKYFHVTASNGIVSNSPYTPLAIMTASPIASVRIFETFRDADVVALGSVRAQRCRCEIGKAAVRQNVDGSQQWKFPLLRNYRTLLEDPVVALSAVLLINDRISQAGC